MRVLISNLLLFSYLFSNNVYFQQHVDYDISVELDDSAHTLSGYEKIDYINNSPDTLKFIWFHIWPNAYKNDSTAFAIQQLRLGRTRFHFSKEKDRGYIDSLNFSVDGKLQKWEYHSEWNDVIKVHLASPLLPGRSVSIETPFFVKLPKIFSRLGHNGKHYEITQWYPKPAVYDKNGWHPMPYLTMGEFYSEFGSFNVKITLPKDYRIMATGDIVNGESELSWLDSLATIGASLNKLKEKEYNSAIKALKKDQKKDQKEKRDNDKVEKKRQLKTIHFRQENVHDFAWFADPNWIVEKGVLTLDESRNINLWSMYLPRNAKTWKRSIEYLHDAGLWYSKFFGDYPYNHITAVDGDMSAGGGMEYPNITVISRSTSENLLEYVIMHEVGHNWLYGILGSNERDFPWMDEGLNEYSNIRYWEKKYADKNNQFVIQEFVQNKLGIGNDLSIHQFSYLRFPGTAMSRDRQPLSISSNENFNFNNYGQNYTRPAVMLRFLQHYIGEETMDKVNQEYFDTWKFRHPYPEDYLSIFKNFHEEDLDWFFDNVLNKTTYIDYALTKSNKEFILTNRGTFNVPVEIAFYDYSGKEISRSWIRSEKKKFKIDAPLNSINATIDPDQYMPDIYRVNNTTKRKLRANFVFETPNYYDYDLNIVPWLFSYNTYNGYTPGLLFWSGFSPGYKKRSTMFTILYDSEHRKPVGNIIRRRGFDGFSIFHSGSWHMELASIQGRNGAHFGFNGLIKEPLTKSPVSKINTNIFYHSLAGDLFDSTNIYDSGTHIIGNITLEKKWIPDRFKNYFIGSGFNVGDRFVNGKIFSGFNYQLNKNMATSFLAELSSFIYDKKIPNQYRYYLFGSVDPDFQQLVIDRKGDSGNLKVLENTYHGHGIRGLHPDNVFLSSDKTFWRIKVDQSAPLIPGKIFLDMAGMPDVLDSPYIASGIVIGPVIIPLYQSWEESDPFLKNIDWIKKRIRFQIVFIREIQFDG